MNKLCRNALASCLAATFAVGGGIAVPAASGASLEQDTAVAGMAVSLDNYYASSQTPEADIMDYIRYIVASAQEKKIIPVFTVNATTKEDGSVVFGTSLVSKDASEKEEGLVSVMASLNVRNKPSVSSNVIGYLYSNCVVSIYDTVDNSEGSWYLIKSGDVEGYVSSDYVLTGAAAKASDEDLTNRYAKVKANTAVVYSSASSSADSVGSVYKDGDYKVLAIQNGFVKIAVNEEFAGFVKAEDVSLYTRHAEAVAITDQMVKNQLDSYLVDIRDAEAIFEKRMAAADYQAAYNASTYAYQLWEYYINDASNAGYTDLVTTAKSEQKKTADMVARATAALMVRQLQRRQRRYLLLLLRQWQLRLLRKRQQAHRHRLHQAKQKKRSQIRQSRQHRLQQRIPQLRQLSRQRRLQQKIPQLRQLSRQRRLQQKILQLQQLIILLLQRL